MTNKNYSRGQQRQTTHQNLVHDNTNKQIIHQEQVDDTKQRLDT